MMTTTKHDGLKEKNNGWEHVVRVIKKQKERRGRKKNEKINDNEGNENYNQISNKLKM